MANAAEESLHLERAMAKRTSGLPVKSVSDDELRALLRRYECPVPFHAVRTRFLGNIASPAMSASPIKVMEGLWGGELPAFDSLDDGNELIGSLIAGLWNRLTRHQDRSTPFRLTRIDAAPTRGGLSTLATMRGEELDGFFEGLFGNEESVELPERAHRGLANLAEIRAMFAAVLDAASDDGIAGTEKDRQTTLQLTRTMTRNAEHEMHEIVLSCVRARRQFPSTLPSRRPTLH